MQPGSSALPFSVSCAESRFAENCRRLRTGEVAAAPGGFTAN